MVSAVALVQGYLQANGFFTITESPVVEATADGFRNVTDLDILAVRLPRTGVYIPGLGDSQDSSVIFDPDPCLKVSTDKVDFIIGEVKEGRAELNRALRSREVLTVALRRLGRHDPDEIDRAIEQLRSKGRANLDDRHQVRLMAFGTQMPNRRHSNYQIILLHQVADFINNVIERHWDLIKHVQFKGPAMGLLMTLEKARIAARRIREGKE